MANLSEAAKSAAREAMEREGSWDDVLRGMAAAWPYIAAQTLRQVAAELKALPTGEGNIRLVDAVWLNKCATAIEETGAIGIVASPQGD